MPARAKTRGREAEFREMYLDPANTVVMLAEYFGVHWQTVLATAKRMGLPPRMETLKALNLPPFGKRKAA